MRLISVTLAVFHTDISGNNFKDLHPLNRLFIVVTLFVFHLDRSGKETKDSQSLKIPAILNILSLFQPKS